MDIIIFVLIGFLIFLLLLMLNLDENTLWNLLRVGILILVGYIIYLSLKSGQTEPAVECLKNCTQVISNNGLNNPGIVRLG